MIDTAAYLERIGYHGDIAPTAAVLSALHHAHLLAVPFENLDIHLGRPIVLDERTLFAKIVRHRRGGFCYELNGLFAALLRALGFEVALLAAQYPRKAGQIAPECDHMVLLARAADDDEPWLVDVGAGRDSFGLPLRTTATAEQSQAEAAFRLVPEGESCRLMRREGDGVWEPRYAFTWRPRALADFDAGCRFHQTSPDSHFPRSRICTRLTPAGRVTLSERRLITTVDGTRTERELEDDAAYLAALLEQFGIDLAGHGEDRHG